MEGTYHSRGGRPILCEVYQYLEICVELLADCFKFIQVTKEEGMKQDRRGNCCYVANIRIYHVTTFQLPRLAQQGAER